ncbi:MAG: class II aldolase/adducin family protein [Alphaproteobacteria bacterium]|nr:class II aldolase/adducin family protein [Alphaproteobacteria bacterium]
MSWEVIDNARSVRDEVSEAEWQTRVELAAACRIAYGLGWNDGVTNHITARLPDAPDRFVMNPQGLGFDEVTASCLVKADLSGEVISDAGLLPGPAGLNFHSAVFAARPEVMCSMHIHPMAGIVVSATKCGLKILDQRGCLLHDQVAYHAFEGYARAKDEAPRIVAELGGRHAMIMKNHGLLTVGRSVGETFYFMDRLLHACELQERVMAMGTEIEPVPEDVIRVAVRQSEERYGNKPYGENDWKLLCRRLERTDPSFMD